MVGGGQRPTIRNPVTALLLMFIPIYGPFIKWPEMLTELQNCTPNQSFFKWGWIIPCYSLFWFLSVLPAQVQQAKQAMGSPKPARGVFLYFLLAPYALACDLNEIADPNWVG